MVVKGLDAAVAGPQQGPRAAGKISQTVVGKHIDGPLVRRQIAPSNGEGGQQFRGGRLGVERGRFLSVVRQFRVQFGTDIHVHAKGGGFNAFHGLGEYADGLLSRGGTVLTGKFQGLDGRLENGAPVLSENVLPNPNLIGQVGTGGQWPRFHGG